MRPALLDAQLSSGTRTAPSFVVRFSLFLGGTLQSCFTPFARGFGLPPLRVLELFRLPDFPPFTTGYFFTTDIAASTTFSAVMPYSS